METGTTLDHFEILGPLGKGGMGEVYRARDTRLGRDVALKVLPQQSLEDDDATERFFREARAASALNHPNVVTVFDVGHGDRGVYIAMELVRGRTLKEFQGAPPDVGTVVSLGVQAARALGEAHDARIIHRDIKPENLMLRDDGYLKVLDFGLARLVAAAGARWADDEASLTVSGVVIGTPRYLSPEQAESEPVTAASDVFSLGVVLYELLTGAHPFASRKGLALIAAILLSDPEPAASLREDVPPDLSALLGEMLDKAPEARPTMREVADRLHAIGEGLPRPTSGSPSSPGFSSSPAPASVAPDGAPTERRPRTAEPIVGRDADRARLLEAWRDATSGRGRLVAVTGEPGVGKTTFVEACLADLARSGDVVVARGRCSERLAGTEAYLPILEAFEYAVAEDTSGRVREVLRRTAPTWYDEMDTSSMFQPRPTEGVGVPEGLHAASPERMKREVRAFLEGVAATRPLVLFLEDLHWADASTVDLLGFLGSRLDAVPLLVVVTYRPTEMQLAEHAFLPLLLDLQSRGVGTELPLGLLTLEDVADLLDRRYPGHRFPPAFAELLLAKTEGSPLFLVDVLRWLGNRGAIADFEGAWQLSGDLPDVERDLPPSVRGMIQRKIEQLEASDRRLLMTAGVQGVEFDSAVLADALGLDPWDVEDRLALLEKVYAFVECVEERDLPDRTPSMRYRFVHALYQNALYSAIPVSRRVRIAAQVAGSIEAHHGARVREVASELAVLWEEARDAGKAAGYYALAATHAAEVFAYTESLELADRGLAQIALLPEGPERANLELGLRVSLGFTNVVTRGFSAPETYEQMARAHELSLEPGRVPQRVPVLWGMVVYHIASGQSERAYGYARQMLEIAAEAGDPMLRAMAESAMSGAALFRAELPLAIASQARAEELAVPEIRAAMRTVVGSDPLILSRCQAARAHWMSGDVERARELFERSMEDVGQSRDPRERAHVALHLVEFETEVGDPAEGARIAAEALAVCEEYGVASEQLWTLAYLGAAQRATGESQLAVETLRQAMALLSEIRCLASYAEYEGYLARALLDIGRVDEARAAVEGAFATVESTGEVVWRAELERIRAEVLRAEGGAHSEVAALLAQAAGTAEAAGQRYVLERIDATR